MSRRIGGLRVIGWGPFSLPGERKLLRRADEKVEAILSELAAVRERVVSTEVAEREIEEYRRRAQELREQLAASKESMRATEAALELLSRIAGRPLAATTAASEEEPLAEWEQEVLTSGAGESPTKKEENAPSSPSRKPRGSDGASIKGAE